MSRSYSDVLARMLEERKRMLAGWVKLVEKAARAVKEIHPEARVYVTGSVVEGRAIAGSDIDLVVALPYRPSAREAARVIAHI